MKKLLKAVHKVTREIDAVGFKNWCWFTFVLRRNEFSPRLNMERYWGDSRALPKMNFDRQRAHEIDLVLSDLK